MLGIEDVQKQVETFLTDTILARALSEKCRDYFNNKQWTPEERQKIESRGQAAIAVNRIKPKVSGLTGLYSLRSSDPKAYPRTQAHEDSSHAVTDALRYVADNNDFSDTRLQVAEEFFVEGYSGAIVDVSQKKSGEIEIRIEEIPWDRIYFDPHSRKRDFSDSRYFGIVMWMGYDEFEEKFKKKASEFNQTEQSDETFEDRPRWLDSRNERIRVALHFYMHKSQWYMCLFTGNSFITKPQLSPFLDEEGEPDCPIELVSANVDRDNNRYGEAADWLDQQDEINHRRSKFLFGLSARQTHGRQGAVADKARLKRELAKPDGHVEWTGDEWGKDVGLIDTGDMSKAQLDLYLDSKAEMDAVSFNAQLSGERQSGDLSGKAIDRLQQAGTIELNRQYNLLSNWEKRIYRQIWNRVKQFWGEEKWIRVTDDQDNLRWVGFNQPITLQQQLEETINDESLNQAERQQAAQVYMPLMQARDPRLAQFVETRNKIPEIDVDIILEQSFDVINIQQEQFQMLAQFAQGGDVDIVELIELSEIRGKEELIEKIEKRRQAQAEAAGNVAQLEANKMQVETLKTQMQAATEEQKAFQTKIENSLLLTNPDKVTSVAV